MYYAVNQSTGEKWTANPHYRNQFLSILPDGQLIVTTFLSDTYSIQPLDKKLWTVVFTKKIKKLMEQAKVEDTSHSCDVCHGDGHILDMIDHDTECNTIWEKRACARCYGTGSYIKK